MCYIIGGRNYSLNDIENGVLRANRRGVANLFPPFGKSDPRRKISLIQVSRFTCEYLYINSVYWYLVLKGVDDMTKI